MKPLIGLLVMTTMCAQNRPTTEVGTLWQPRVDVLTEPKTKSTIIALTNEEGELKDDVKITVELFSDKNKYRAFVLFSNKSQRPLWFPSVEYYSHKPDYQDHTLSFWFGYLYEVWGGSFKVPSFHLVPPGGEDKFEIRLDQRLLNILAMQRMTMDLKVRIATDQIATSTDLDHQPVEEYLKNSIVINAKQTKYVCENKECVSPVDQSVLTTDDCSMWQTKVDESVFYYGMAPDVAKLTAEEKVHAISCLMEMEGRRGASDMGGYTRLDYPMAQILDYASIEVAALYYIRYIYLQKWDHANAIALINKRHYHEHYKVNTKSSVRAAYRSYKKWFEKVKAIGIDEARKQGLDPMDDCPGVEWF